MRSARIPASLALLCAANLLSGPGCASVGAAPAGAAARSPGAQPSLFPFCAGDRYGYIDRSGAVVVPPKYAYAEPFEREFAKVAVMPPGVDPRKGTERMRGGFIDARGRVAVEPIYENAHAFTEGLAAVKRDGAWGFVDARGAVRIPFQFEHADAFSEGLALVKSGTGQRFIDANGRTVLDVSRLRWKRGGRELPVIASRAFVEGLALFNVVLRGENPDVLYGYMDRTGRIVVEPAFTYAFDFQGGFAKVTAVCDRPVFRRCDGVVDRSGAWVIPPIHEFLGSVEGGLVAFSALVGKEHLFGFLDTKNEVVLAPRMEFSCLWFSEGLCYTMNRKRWAFVDRSWAEVLVLPPDTKHADLFSDGLAKITTARGDHFIRRDGSVAFEGTFKDAGRFRGGLAWVQFLDGAWGYVNREGRVVYRQADPCWP